MIVPLPFTVSIDILKNAVNTVDISEFKCALNEPTNDFFYDPWTLKNEYVGTVWEQILNTLPYTVGEARIIVLKPGNCYISHADIDDRYHLNISGEHSFLINLDTRQMFPQTLDGIWYSMNAGPRHSAVNFGNVDRIQLVVRKLLKRNNLSDYSTVIIKPISIKPRYTFDDIISPWLNTANKHCLIDNFKTLTDGVQFDIDNNIISILDTFPKDKFEIKIL